MQTEIMSQDKAILGTFDPIEANKEKPTQVIGWTTNLLDGKGFRVLGDYNTPEIAKKVIDDVMMRENTLSINFIKKVVYRMPEPDGITKL